MKRDVKNGNSQLMPLWQYIATLVAVVVMIGGGVYKILRDQRSVEIRLSEKIERLGHEIISNRFATKLTCQSVKFLCDPSTDGKAAKQLLEMGEIGKISKGTFIDLDQTTASMGPLGSIRPNQFEELFKALEKGECIITLGTELPVSHDEKFSFIESNLSKTTWGSNISDDARRELRRGIGVISSTGPVVMYYRRTPRPIGESVHTGVWGWE